MPNGGSDNCLTCGFNAANQGKWDSHEYRSSAKDHCIPREINIDGPAYTYCENRATRNVVPAGPLFTTEIVFIYTRIPWYGAQKPEMFVENGKCKICGKAVEKGIRIKLDGQDVEFCNDKHYVEWWQQQFPGEILYYQYDWDRIYEAFAKVEVEAHKHRNIGLSLDMSTIDPLFESDDPDDLLEKPTDEDQEGGSQ